LIRGLKSLNQVGSNIMPNSGFSNNVVIAVPVVKVGSEYYLSPHFGRAPLFALIEVSSNSYKIRNVVENPYAVHERGKGRGIVEFLVSQGVNAIIVLGIGYGAFYRLKERGIKVYYVPVREQGKGVVSLSKAIEMCVNKQLEEAVEPREYE